MSVISKSSAGNKYPNSIVDEEWEYLDPTPDIHALFLQFDERFFNGQLQSVVVKWSPRMTVCAGLCRYEGRRSGHCSISLSVPLLKLRPRRDLVETLLHEMIHAFLFLTNNNRDRDGHGPEFQFHMNRINQETGTRISIYHSFHDEVKLYKQHWWKCSGPCQHRHPFYGLVKRSMNRAPGPNDLWWAEHQANCGGSYVKIKEPENYGAKKKKEVDSAVPGSKKPKIEAPGTRDIRGFFNSPPAGPSTSTAVSAKTSQPTTTKGKAFPGSMTKNKGSSTVTVRSPLVDSNQTTDAKPTQGGVVVRPTTSFTPFFGQGRVLGGGVKTEIRTATPASFTTASVVKPKMEPRANSAVQSGSAKNIEIVCLDDSRHNSPEEKPVPCPVCKKLVQIDQMNAHLDACLTSSF